MSGARKIIETQEGDKQCGKKKHKKEFRTNIIDLVVFIQFTAPNCLCSVKNRDGVRGGSLRIEGIFNGVKNF